MTLLVQVIGNRLEVESPASYQGIVIAGFTDYSLEVEGTQIRSRDNRFKQLYVEVGVDGSVIMRIVPAKTLEDEQEARIEKLRKLLPSGYELYHETEAAKVIKGVRGRYYHFRHKEKGAIISFNTGAGAKAYRITLGSLKDPDSKIRKVLEALPDRPFKKAQLVFLLPQNIVENRQPIKAAIDILEKEGYVKKISTKGSSEEYIRTEKIIPPIQRPQTL